MISARGTPVVHFIMLCGPSRPSGVGSCFLLGQLNLLDIRVTHLRNLRNRSEVTECSSAKRALMKIAECSTVQRER